MKILKSLLPLTIFVFSAACVIFASYSHADKFASLGWTFAMLSSLLHLLSVWMDEAK